MMPSPKISEIFALKFLPFDIWSWCRNVHQYVSEGSIVLLQYFQLVGLHIFIWQINLGRRPENFVQK